MNTSEMQQLKMAWLAAREAGDMQTQMSLLHDHPAEQATLIDFIAAYHASGGSEAIDQGEPLLRLTNRACLSALERVFAAQVAFANLAELRKSRSMSKVEVAKSLRLTVDVWNKFEAGAIELVSLSRHQIERLALFFEVSIDQFSELLHSSQPALTLNRRQTKEAALQPQGPQKQSFSEAVERSTMTQEDRQFWLNV